MGLDIHCNGEHVKVGSYTGVHIVRKKWLHATIKYLENLLVESSKETFLPPTCEFAEYRNEYIGDYQKKLEKFIKLLKTTSQQYPINNISTLIEKMDDFIEFNVVGLLWWISHSDCEGFLSSGQSSDILNLLSNICFYMDNDDDDYYFNENDKMASNYKMAPNYYLHPVFDASATSGKPVQFS